MPSLPVGDCVPSVSEMRTPRRMDYEGEYIALSPLDSEKDAPELFACSHGTELVESCGRIWRMGLLKMCRLCSSGLRRLSVRNSALFFCSR